MNLTVQIRIDIRAKARLRAKEIELMKAVINVARLMNSPAFDYPLSQLDAFLNDPDREKKEIAKLSAEDELTNELDEAPSNEVKE